MEGAITQPETPTGAAIAIIASDGSITLQGNTGVGTIDSGGTITWQQPNAFDLSSGSVSGGVLHAAGSVVNGPVTTHTRLELKTGGSYLQTESLDGYFKIVNPINSIHDSVRVLHDGSRFAALGANGAISVSPDGITWETRHTGSGQPMRDLAYGGGTYVAVGEANTVLTSTDLVTWTPRASGIGDIQNWAIKTVEYFNGRFYIGNIAGGITRSADGSGATWEAAIAASNPVGAYADPLIRRLNGRLYLASKNVFANHGSLYYSTDGQNFTPCSFNSTTGTNVTIRHLSYGNGLYVANLGIQTATSADGISFTKASTPADLQLLAFDGVRFLSRGAGSSNTPFYHSTDGAAWTTGTASSLKGATDVATSGGTRVAVGAEGRISQDGLAWNLIASSNIHSSLTGSGAPNLRAVFGNGLHILHGGSQNLVTRDGIAWTTVPAKSPIAFGCGVFLSGNEISIDGQLWIPAGIPLTGGETVIGTAADGATLLAVTSNNRAFTSTDGFSWTHANPGSPVAHTGAITGANGQWIALGSGGAYSRSLDGGTTWTNGNLGNATLNAAAYGNGRWVVVADSGRIYAGDTLSSLSSVGPTLTAGGDYDSLVFLDGNFFARRDNFGTYFVSDGLSGSPWVEKSYSHTTPFTTISTGPSFALITGRNDSVIRVERNQVGQPLIASQPPASLTLTQEGTLQLQAAVLGDSPVTYRWFRNGLPLSNGVRVAGADGAVLTISNLRGTDAGTYHLVASNSLGSDITLPAQVGVNLKATVLTPPSSLVVTPGGNATFSVAASADTTAIQWLLDGVPIPGATSSTLEIQNADQGDAGIYQARLTNAHGDILSPPASLSFSAIADGITLDETYSSNTPITNPAAAPPAGENSIREMIELPDGKLIVGGYFLYNVAPGTSGIRSALARLNADGTLDTTFAIPRLVFNDSGIDRDAAAIDIQLLPDNSILALMSGTVNRIGSTNISPVRMLRFDQNGTRLSLTIPTFNSTATIYAMHVDGDGRILLAGNSIHGTGNGTGNSTLRHIARFNADGSLDASFDGRNTTISLNTIRAIHVSAAGDLLAGGVGASNQVRVARLTSSGTLAPGFVQPGFGTTGESSLIYSVQWLDAGGFLAMGRFTAANGVSRQGIALFDGNGALDTTFAPTAPFDPIFTPIVMGAVPLPGGRFIAVGTIRLRDTNPPQESIVVFDPQGNASVPASLMSEATTISGYSSRSFRCISPGAGGAFHVGTWIKVSSLPNARRILKLNTASGPLPGAPALAITGHSGGGFAEPGDSVTFAVSAIGGDLSYQWFKGGVPVQDATSSSFVISPAGVSDAGVYTVRVTDHTGTVTSSGMTLTLDGAIPGPTFASWKDQYSFPPGQDGFGDDPAGDGVANGFKYLFGLDPNVPAILQTLVPHPSGNTIMDGSQIISANSAASLPSPGAEAGKGHRIVSCRLPADMKGLSFEVQVSTTLIFGDGSASAHALGAPVEDNGFLIHSFYLTPATNDASQLFWRLTISE